MSSFNQRIFPSVRIKKIIALDDDAPKINKASIVALSKATKVFLNVYASHIHRHIVETESSYPVKVNHIIEVAKDPRYLMYQFLTDATNLLEATDDAAYNSIRYDGTIRERHIPILIDDSDTDVGVDTSTELKGDDDTTIHEDVFNGKLNGSTNGLRPQPDVTSQGNTIEDTTKKREKPIKSGRKAIVKRNTSTYEADNDIRGEESREEDDGRDEYGKLFNDKIQDDMGGYGVKPVSIKARQTNVSQEGVKKKVKSILSYFQSKRV